MTELKDVPIWLWVVVAAALLTQGISLFRNAQSRGLRGWAWFWGIWELTSVPGPGLCYLLLIVWPDRRRRHTQR